MEFGDSYKEIVDSEFKRCFTLIDNYRELCEKLIKENNELKRKNLELVDIIFKQQDDQQSLNQYLNCKYAPENSEETTINGGAQ